MKPVVFFRTDDLGRGHNQFFKLIDLFAHHRMKLTTAAIPALCRLSLSAKELKPYSPYLEIHSHGLSHKNYESLEKNSEFGPSRDLSLGRQDLEHSLSDTQSLFGELYFPVFTPPWNRIDDKFLPVLKDTGFYGLSRRTSRRARLIGPLPELNITVDLHSKKAARPTLPELQEAILSSGPSPLGLMLHHEDMLEYDFDVLNKLLAWINDQSIEALNFKQMLSGL